MKDKILIIGGYGQVGQYVSKQLVKNFPKKVIVAGRDYKKAKALTATLDEMATPLELDIYNRSDLESKMVSIKVVVMCLSARNNNVALYCIKNGIHYIDISPSNDITCGIESYKKKSKLNNVTCVLGVGLAPGLSNLIVKKLCQNMDFISDADIFLMLGLGENHGTDGVKWLLDNIGKDFSVTKDGITRHVSPFIEKKKTTFPKHLGLRTAYRFNLADQYIIPKTLDIKNVASYFCYDSKLITKGVNVLKQIGLFDLLEFKPIYRFMSSFLKLALYASNKLNLGTDTYSIKVNALGIKDNEKYFCQAGIIGNDNSSFTGKMAAFVAEKIYYDNRPFGVFYLEELFDFDDLCNSFKIDIEMKVKNIKQVSKSFPS